MRTLYFFIIFTCFLGLASCATAPIPPAAKNESITWGTRTKTLSEIQSWDLKGLIAIRHLHEAWSATLQWQQRHQNYHIALFGPLGTHSIELTGQPGKVVLATSDGKRFNADSPESLLTKQLGWNIPVSNLLYWIRGLPVPSLPAEKRFDHYNHLIVLNQQGWQIQYLRYTSINGIDVPNKIFLNNPELNVKIIINQWNLS